MEFGSKVNCVYFDIKDKVNIHDHRKELIKSFLVVKSACFYRYRSRFGKLSKRKGFRAALSRIIVFEIFVSRNSAVLVPFSQFGFKYKNFCLLRELAVWSSG